MNRRHVARSSWLLVAVVTVAVLFAVEGALARTQLNVTSYFGGQVNLTKVEEVTILEGKGNTPTLAQIASENICTGESGDVCQHAGGGADPGWYLFPSSIAVDQTNQDFYVVDNNDRVDKFGPNGEFILMWGWDVNQTKVESGAPQLERDICTLAEMESALTKAKCQAGEPGTGLAEQMNEPQDLAVDPSTGNVYVADFHYRRIDEFSATGEFKLMFGGEVNANKTNVCSATETCKSGILGPGTGFFELWAQNFGTLLAVGANHLLYVADRGRVQMFSESGEAKGQLTLSAPPFHETNYVTGLAVDGSGDVFVTESHHWPPNETEPAKEAPAGVHEFNSSNIEIKTFDSVSVGVDALTVDSSGRLTVMEGEPAPGGRVYDSSGNVAGEFGAGLLSRGLTYDDTTGRLYVVLPNVHEIRAFASFTTPEAITDPPTSLTATSATFVGLVNAESNDPAMTATSDFEYERCKETLEKCGWNSTAATVPAEVLGTTSLEVTAQLQNLRPNQIYHYRVSAHDENGTSVAANEAAFTTLPVPPLLEAAPTVSFVGDTSAVLSGVLNPENATTEYMFEYARCAHEAAECDKAATVTECGTTEEAPVFKSAKYAEVGVSYEVVGLSSSTLYCVQLVATNEHSETSSSPLAAFMTVPPVTVHAETGSASAVASTSAVVSGFVNPGGQPATYAFELGVDAGAATQYGIVFSGPAGAATEPVEKTLALTGLQPGTTYSYRIKLESGYGEALGAATTFTTNPSPSSLSLPIQSPMLAPPEVKFPTVAKKPTPAQLLARALKACSKKPKRKRAACRNAARRKTFPRVAKRAGDGDEIRPSEAGRTATASFSKTAEWATHVARLGTRNGRELDVRKNR